MSETLTPRVLVVGGGPGGYVAAIRAGQLGLDTVLVDAGGLGGTCLLRGCIPSKALIEVGQRYAAMRQAERHGLFGMHIKGGLELDFGETIAWKDSVVKKLNSGVRALLKKAKVHVVEGWVTFSDAKTCNMDTAQGPLVIKAENVVLATGSSPAPLPGLPFCADVLSSTEALSLKALPKSLAVVGGGYIGLELGSAFADFGVDVTVIEATFGILPRYDRALVAPVKSALEQKGIGFRFGVRATGFEKGVLTISGNGGDVETVKVEKVLLTIGRQPNLEGWGLENMAIEMAGPFIKVDSRCATSTTGVWAIGDVVGEPMLAHKASAQGEMVAEIIAGKRRTFDPVAVPAVCFTDPEIVSVGAAPTEMSGTREHIFPFAANGRALTLAGGPPGGFVRIVAHDDGHRIVGVQAVGPHISELAAAFVIAVEAGLTLEDIEGIIYPHPTLGEAFHEAALKGLGHAIHI